MARNEKPSGKGKIKFRFIEFEMDGGDSTLQDAIREITRAVGRPQLPKTSAAISGPASAREAEIIDAGEDQEESSDSPDESSDGDAEDSSPRPPRRFKSPKIVQIDLRGGDSPLKGFLGKLAPDSDSKRYMAIAYWFKTFRDTAEVTPDHIYTAYKEMGWTNIPRDVGAPLRLLKSDGSMEKGGGKQAYILNHIGEGKVDDMLQKMSPAQ